MASHSLFVTHYCITNRYNIANVNTMGVAFKASSTQLDGAMRRTARCSFAYRHTSERISQHYVHRRANLSLLLACTGIYVLQFTPLAILVLYCRVVFMCLTFMFSGRLRTRPPISLWLCNRSSTCTFTQPTFAPMA